MNLLGNTLEEIAFEKAGIIKENVPVVIGEKKKETEYVFRNIASQKDAPIFFAEEKFSVERYQLLNNSIEISVADENSSTTNYQLDLPGIYQTKNILTALQTIELLKEWNISQEDIHTALKNVKQLTGLHGRWEVIHEDPTIVLEVAHNKDGIEQMLQHLRNISFDKLRFVLGVVKDKDVDAVLGLLPKEADYYFTHAHIPRALDAKLLKEKASTMSLKGNYFDDVNEAIQQALVNSEKDDLIIVCGSIFLVAEVNKELVTQQA
jgi:dihydrofolate synthase/folylpolyglutamate synthase